MQSKTYAIIICGGSGSRLWPRSRSHRPKHLLQLNGGETMVQQTVARLNLPYENIFCVTEESHSDVLREQLSEIPAGNIVVEPGRRGTASAIGLGLSRLREVAGDEAVALCMWADSLIPDTEHFQKTLAAWTEAAEESKKVVLLGIQPTYASTGLGYIRMGSPITDVGGPLYEVDAFVEKPDAPTAADYYKSGKYLWNSGLFAARVGVLWQELSRHIPDLVKNLEKLAKAKNADKAREIYLGLETEIIDYGLFEKSDNLGVLPATFQWADVGSWADLYDMLEQDEDGNIFDGNYVDIDSHNCFVHSPNQLVATIGLDDIVIINTDDAVLICPKNRSQDVKKVVQKMKDQGLEEYL